MANAITLYHCWGARSFRALWTLEELGLKYRLELLPFPPRVLAPEYLELNPLGTIPLLVDGSARITESAAICQYLVTRYGPTPLAVGVDEPQYAAFLNFLHFGEATLTFPQTIVLRYTRLERPEKRLPQAAEDYARWFLARLRVVDAIVAEHPFICGERFTAADISIGFALMLTRFTGLEDYLPTATKAYWGRLQARAGFQSASAIETDAADRQGFGRMPPIEPFAFSKRK